MKRKPYSGSLEKLDTQEIYLNVSYLNKGVYQLKIVHNNKILKSTLFIKH
ncbi:hypothetical protein J1N09_01690 [Aureitalea sp. L0-47]|nr:hypothetical protein [Aureitalea sp. L0-47]MCW5518533.1 hypothetical protein [Aureitalea sp. L0-47]